MRGHCHTRCHVLCLQGVVVWLAGAARPVPHRFLTQPKPSALLPLLPVIIIAIVELNQAPSLLLPLSCFDLNIIISSSRLLETVLQRLSVFAAITELQPAAPPLLLLDSLSTITNFSELPSFLAEFVLLLL